MNNSNPDEITPVSETPAVPKGMAMAREIFDKLHDKIEIRGNRVRWEIF